MARWKCLGCGATFEAEWKAKAWVMGKACPGCGGVAAASERQAFESGCMKVEPGVAEPGEEGGELGKAGGRSVGR